MLDDVVRAAPRVEGRVGLREPFSEETLFVCLYFLLGHVIAPFGPLGTSQLGAVRGNGARGWFVNIRENRSLGGNWACEGEGGRKDFCPLEEGRGELHEGGLETAR